MLKKGVREIIQFEITSHRMIYSILGGIIGAGKSIRGLLSIDKENCCRNLTCPTHQLLATVSHNQIITIR